jgi:hypothetical protein
MFHSEELPDDNLILAEVEDENLEDAITTALGSGSHPQQMLLSEDITTNIE